MKAIVHRQNTAKCYHMKISKVVPLEFCESDSLSSSDSDSDEDSRATQNFAFAVLFLRTTGLISSSEDSSSLKSSISGGERLGLDSFVRIGLEFVF